MAGVGELIAQSLARDGLSRLPTSLNEQGVENDFTTLTNTVNEVTSSSIDIPTSVNSLFQKWTRKRFLEISFTSQNEFFGDQTDNVVRIYPAQQAQSLLNGIVYNSDNEFDEVLFYLVQTNAAAANTGNAVQLQYYNGSVWTSETGALLTITGVTTPILSTGWLTLSAGWQSAAGSLNPMPIRAKRSITDANTDIPSLAAVFRKTYSYVDFA